MKVKVCDVKLTEKSAFVKGIRTRKIGDQFVDEAVSIRFRRDQFQMPPRIKFPWVLDIGFVKGTGAYVKEDKD